MCGLLGNPSSLSWATAMVGDQPGRGHALNLVGVVSLGLRPKVLAMVVRGVKECSEPTDFPPILGLNLSRLPGLPPTPDFQGSPAQTIFMIPRNLCPNVCAIPTVLPVYAHES